MKAPQALLLVVATALTLASGASVGAGPGAGAGATKQRVAITANLYPKREFVLTPLHAGALERDFGKARMVYGTWSSTMRKGQDIEILRAFFTFEGKRGSLTIRERTEWVDAGVDSGGPSIATGNWEVVRGTGEYAQVAGGGRSAHSGLSGGTDPWYARQEGFLSLP